MKDRLRSASTRFLQFCLISAFIGLLGALPARAGLSVIMQLALEINKSNPSFTFTNYQILLFDVETNANGAAAPLGAYLISSPGGAINEGFQLTNTGIINITGNDSAGFPDYGSFINELTNGNWTILVTNATSSNLYSFKINSSGFSSNSLPQVNVTSPQTGATNVANNPVFTWQALPSWGAGDIQVEDNNTETGFFQENFLATSQTSWSSPSTLPDGPNTFIITYVGSSSVLTAPTPTNNLSQPISGWNFSAFPSTYTITSFSVTNTSVGSPGTTPLVAHYNFNDGSLAATDSSGNGNTLAGHYNDGNGSIAITNDAKEGAHAAAFNAPFSFSGGNYYTDDTNLLNALAGSFSVSLWLKTSQVAGNNTDSGIFSGAGIVSALAWNHTSSTNYVNPMILTGSNLAFVTVGGGGTVQDTLHSATPVNTGQYVHVVVTRDQPTGQKKIYVNGALDASDFGPTNLLNGSPFLQIGMNNGQGFNGDMDDIQFYSAVLSASQVTQLYQNPGTTVLGVAPALPVALDATNLTWTTSGNANWFSEVTTSHDGFAAAQSGRISGVQTSTLQTTVTGPGTLTFWWQTAANDFNFDLECDLDGNYVDDISFNQSWTQEPTVTIPPGQHTLTWTAFGNGGATTNDAGWVDQVQYSMQAVPVSVNFSLTIQRDHYNGTNDLYFVYPNITFISPSPATTNRIESPAGGQAYSEVLPGNSSDVNGGNPGLYGTLDQAVDACTNGPWTLYINKGDPGEQDFFFYVSIGSLDSNLLSPVNVLVPALNATNVATNSPMQWSGPAGFSSIFVDTTETFPASVFTGYTNLPAAATNWPSPPALPYGTNSFLVEYDAFNVTNVTFTTPVDGSLNPVSTWNPQGQLTSYSYSSFVVGASAPVPVQLSASPPQTSGGNFQLGFQTIPGRPETIQVRTNLTLGMWMDVTNFIGDGSVQQFAFPVTNSPGQYFRVITQ